MREKRAGAIARKLKEFGPLRFDEKHNSGCEGLTKSEIQFVHILQKASQDFRADGGGVQCTVLNIVADAW
jgi:hypothetical protein